MMKGDLYYKGVCFYFTSKNILLTHLDYHIKVKQRSSIPNITEALTESDN